MNESDEIKGLVAKINMAKVLDKMTKDLKTSGEMLDKTYEKAKRTNDQCDKLVEDIKTQGKGFEKNT